jgi:hypothetical protein
MLSRR